MQLFTKPGSTPMQSLSFYLRKPTKHGGLLQCDGGCLRSLRGSTCRPCICQGRGGRLGGQPAQHAHLQARQQQLLAHRLQERWQVARHQLRDAGLMFRSVLL